MRSKAPCSNSISIKEAATEAKRISARLEKYVDVLLDEPETSIRVLLGLDLDAESRNSNVPNIDMEIKPEAEDELWIPETPHRTISKDEAGSPILRLNASTPGLLQSPTKSPMKSGQSAPLTSFTRGQYESFNNQADEVLREAANMTAGFVVSANPEVEIPKLDVQRAKKGRNENVSASVRAAMNILHTDSSRSAAKDSKEGAV